MIYRFLIACCLFVWCAGTTTAQPEAPIYKGLRISLFNIQILKQNKKSVTLLCQGANTGRLPVVLSGKNTAAAAALLVELDSLRLPPELQGREQLITAALRRQKMRLEPGDIRENIRLIIPLRKQAAESLSSGKTNGQHCPDLVFDTAYVAEYKDKTMLLYYAIRNKGAKAAYLLGSSERSVEDNVAVNVYFVSGTKLSRGAIYADGVFIREGIETLDGILQPGQVLRGALEISLKNRSRFSPNLVFELDPFQRVEECDRTNNSRAVVIEF
jgi:hypothetical protein